MRPILGVDMEDLRRFENASEALVNRILSDLEKPLYEALTSAKRKKEFLGGRFAAKEAYKKAYQTFERPVAFTEVSVLKNADGSPTIMSTYKSDDVLLVSISHTDDRVIAVVSGETT